MLGEVLTAIVTPFDKDGAVDFNQGIEYFNILRRLRKPVVMLQYEGENHGLAKAENQRDYSVRMREFFDHHLKGAATPPWLADGVKRIAVIDAQDRVVPITEVVGNTFYSNGQGDQVKALVALDEADEVIWRIAAPELPDE